MGEPYASGHRQSPTEGVDDAINTVKGAAAAKGITLSSEVPLDLPPAYADPNRLRQVLINLLENAIRFTPSQGAVGLKAWALPGEPEMLQLSVSDTGCGINPDLYERIFERLYQVTSSDSSRNGLGLGLYICKELVAKQGGRIWVETSSSLGTTFCFTLPALSLADLLAPLLSQEPHRDSSIAIIGAEIWKLEGWLSEGVREVVTRQARYVLSRCVLPGLDVILPKMYSGGSSEFLFLAARADLKGADVIVKRIQSQLDRDEVLRREGAKCAVDLRMVPAPQGEAAEPNNALAKRIANVVRKEIEEWTRFKRGDKSE
jgi:anti-sigma regulatory factor (Ser/Thr protein kinase)